MDFYKNYEQMMDFSAATVENPFGAQLLSLCERKFEDIETAVAVLTEGLDELGFDVDEEGVIGLMTGEILPTEELVEAVAGLADSDADVKRLYNGAALMYEEATGAVDDDEDYEDEVEEVADEDYEDEVEYEYDGNEEDVADSRVDQLYSRQIITDRLNQLVEVADQMMDPGAQGLMTPHIKSLLFGQSDKNRFANFSAACDDFEVDPQTYLHCLEFSLGLLAELDGINSAYFSAQAEDEMATREQISFSSNLNDTVIEKEARQMLADLGL